MIVEGNFEIFLVSYVGGRPWWPKQSPTKPQTKPPANERLGSSVIHYNNCYQRHIWFGTLYLKSVINRGPIRR